MVLDCKCHGVSGSCQVKTCWKTLSSFRVVGTYLRDRYHNGVLVTVDQNGNELVLADGIYSSNPRREDLVYLEESPDYCVPNSNTGSLGTTGRSCNKTLPGHGSCGILCCGRGFNTIQIEQEYKCACKFHWCCYVKCKTCRRTMDKHVCKSPEDMFSYGKPDRQLTLNTDSNSNRPKTKPEKTGTRRRTKENREGAANSLQTGNSG